MGDVFGVPATVTFIDTYNLCVSIHRLGEGATLDAIANHLIEGVNDDGRALVAEQLQKQLVLGYVKLALTTGVYSLTDKGKLVVECGF